MNFYEKLRELNCQRNRLFRIIKRKISPLNIIQYFYRSSPDYDLKHVKKILLIRNDLISDMVFTTGLIRNLAQAGYEIYVSSRPNALEIIKHNPYVQGTFAFDDSSWCNFYHFMKQICQHQFDLAIELRPNFPFYKKKEPLVLCPVAQSDFTRLKSSCRYHLQRNFYLHQFAFTRY